MNNFTELSEEQQNLFRTGVKSMLHEGIVVVKFVKSDQTTREMSCTLSDSIIPTEKQPKANPDKPARAQPTTSCSVFDVEKQEWRSFRYDAIIDMQPKI